jgi:PAS domain S-box-containing protein
MANLTSQSRPVRLLVVFLVVLPLLLFACQQNPTGKTPPEAIRGVLDLTGWDFEQDGPVDLSGEWEFYWRQHLYSQQFALPRQPDISAYVNVPQCWNAYSVEGGALPGQGFATFRLTIRMSQPADSLAFDRLDISSAYRLYVNGKKVDAVGIAGKSFETTDPGFHRGISHFVAGDNTTEVILQVSNFHHRLGGLWESIRLGPEDNIRKKRERGLGFDLFLCGSILIIGLYHLCLYFLRQNDKTTLYFSILSFLIVFRLLATGGRYFVLLWPEVPWELMIKIEYLSFYLATPVFATFCYHFFTADFSKWALQALQIAGIGFSALVLLTPVRIFSHSVQAYQVITIAGCLYGIYVLVLAQVRKRQGAILFSLGFAVLFITVLNDILYSQMIIRTAYVSPLGLFVFLLLQAFLLSRHYAMAFNTVEAQSLEMMGANKILWQEIIERSRAQKALQEANSIINRSPAVAFLRKNRAGWPVEFVSDNVKELFGYTSDEFTSGEVTYAGTIHPDDLERVTREIETFSLDTDKTVLVHQPYRILSKDGSEVWLDDRTYVRRDADGKATHFEGIVIDITASVQAAKALRESKEKLARSRKMESLGLLAGGVAHDLNNVLTGIVSYPDLLLLKLPEKSPLREYIEAIKASGGRAVALVQDLLTVARGVATPKEPISINDIVNDYLSSPEFYQLKRYHRDIRFEARLGENLLNISGSKVHIAKVVMNLVSNAAEAIKNGGRVAIATDNRYIDVPLSGYDDIRIGEYAVLTVSDNGSGISSTDLERIFEPFYTRKVMGRSGTGLGLAVVWNVVQDHSGYIDVKTDSEGTRFDLFFPITRDKLIERDPATSPHYFRGNGEKILIVDDEKNQRDIAGKMLESMGYETSAVASGEEAVNYLKSNGADLIVLDMIMDPGMNGRETLECILKDRPGQKAIIVSGYAETDDVKKMQKMGAGAFIRKPLTLDRLGVAVKSEITKQPSRTV